MASTASGNNGFWNTDLADVHSITSLFSENFAAETILNFYTILHDFIAIELDITKGHICFNGCCFSKCNRAFYFRIVL